MNVNNYKLYLYNNYKLLYKYQVYVKYILSQSDIK